MFQIKCPESSELSTKRNVLNTIAAIYDRLQFLATLIVRAKMLKQEMWLAGLDWDHVLPSHLAKKWTKWVSEFPCLSRFTIPRPLRLMMHMLLCVFG
jgi:Zn-dependent M28 family amino/carboxypeptidase